MSDLKYIGKNILNHDLILKKGHVSGSAASTGSFGSLRVNSFDFVGTNANPDSTIVLGKGAGASLTASYDNNEGVIIGDNAASAVQKTHGAIIIGHGALSEYSGGSSTFNRSVVIGYDAAKKHANASDNVYIGSLVASVGTAAVLRNVAVGANSLQKAASSYNTVVGYDAGKNSTGDGGTYLGAFAGNAGAGDRNVSIGYSAGSGINSSTSDESVFVGFMAGQYNSAGGTLTHAGYSVVLGHDARPFQGQDNQILIGADVVGTGANHTVIGNSSQTQVTFGGTNTLISGSATSTGSFGHLVVQGNITASGAISIGTEATTHAMHGELNLHGGSSNTFVVNALYSDGSKNADFTFRNPVTGANGGALGIRGYYLGANSKILSLGANTGAEYWSFTSTKLSGAANTTGSFGHLIVAGNITASGTVRADAFESVTGGSAIDFKDSLNITGNLTASGDLSIDDLIASGNISGSATSTGSFGFGKIADKTYIGEDPISAGNVYLSVSSDQHTVLNVQSVGSGKEPSIQFVRSDGEKYYIQHEASGLNHKYYSGGGGSYPSYMFVDNSQNIGIGGQTSPSHKLDVTGTGRFTDTLTTVAINASGNISGSATSTGSFGHLNIKGPGDNVANFQAGNRSLSLKLNDSAPTGDVGVQFRAGSGDYFGLAAGGGSGHGIVIHSNNYVAIGHASPTVELDVNGAIKASGTITANGNIVGDNATNISAVNDITALGNISGSATSTGSFGDVMVANNLALGGDPIYNVGTTGANLTITANNPYINLNDSNSTSGTRVFSIGSDNNKLKFAKMTDDGGTKVEQFLMNGNGNFSMGAGAGNLVEHTNSTGGNLTLDGNNPALNLYDNNASSGARNKAILSMGGALYIGKTADNGTSAVHHIVVDDSGNVEVPVGNISGSATSTGSFGNLKVAGMSVPDVTVFSSSLSTRITADSSSFAARITADSSSFAARDTLSETTSSKILNGELEFTNITGSGHISMSLSSTGSFGRVEATTIGGHSPLSIDSVSTFKEHTIFTNYISASSTSTLDLKGQLLIQTGSILGDLHIRTNESLMRFGKATSGLTISGSTQVSRFATADDGSTIDLGFTITDEDGDEVVSGDGDGIHVDSNNYWYNNTFHKVGDGSKNYLQYDGKGMKYYGKLYAQTGSIDGELYIKSPTGSMFIGKYTGGFNVSGLGGASRYATGSDGSIIDLGFTVMDEEGATQVVATGDGLYVDDNSYWYTTGNFRVGDGSKKIDWNKQSLTISASSVDVTTLKASDVNFSNLPTSDPLVTGSLWVSGSSTSGSYSSGFVMISGIHG